MSSLPLPTKRAPRLTRVSEGKPLRRLLVTSKALGVEVIWLESHGTPPRENRSILSGRASYSAQPRVASDGWECTWESSNN